MTVENRELKEWNFKTVKQIGNGKWNVGIVHTPNHWRLLHILSSMNRVINVSSSQDMKLFYQITNANCNSVQSQYIRYWNQRFTNYKIQNNINFDQIKPLVDTDGVFCYLKDDKLEMQIPDE